MSKALLGDIFDIHGGGIDLQFPHHENEVAQSCCANHTEVMAKVWMHNGFLQVEGEKMAKSLGNFFTVKDLLDQGVPGEVIRFVLLSAQYRQPLDWTQKAIDEAERTLVKWGEVVRGKATGEVPKEFVDALADDLNTPRAIAVLHKLAKEGRAEGLWAAIRFLGLGVIVAARGHAVGAGAATAIGETIVHGSAEVSGEAGVEVDNNQADFTSAETELINDLLIKRKDARKQKNYQEADRIRDALIVAGVDVRDTPQGPTFRRTSDFDAAKLEGLINA
jgi:cysteinyl-tRNA synthetase